MAVTINTQVRGVFGNKRYALVNLDIGADADTWNTGFTTIDYFNFRPPDETAVGGTKSGGTITFQTAGAVSGADLLVIGI